MTHNSDEKAFLVSSGISGNTVARVIILILLKACDFSGQKTAWSVGCLDPVTVKLIPTDTQLFDPMLDDLGGAKRAPSKAYTKPVPGKQSLFPTERKMLSTIRCA